MVSPPGVVLRASTAVEVVQTDKQDPLVLIRSLLQVRGTFAAMDSDGPTDLDADASLDEEDYDVVEAWTSEGAGLAFDGRVVEYFPARGPSVRMHIRNLEAEVKEGAAGSATITLESPGATQSFLVAAADLPAVKQVVGTINATSELLDAEPGLDHW